MKKPNKHPFADYCNKQWDKADGRTPAHCFHRGQEKCGICGIEWLARRLKRIARSHGYVTKYHSFVFERWLDEALSGRRRK